MLHHTQTKYMSFIQTYTCVSANHSIFYTERVLVNIGICLRTTHLQQIIIIHGYDTFVSADLNTCTRHDTSDYIYIRQEHHNIYLPVYGMTHLYKILS